MRNNIGRSAWKLSALVCGSLLAVPPLAPAQESAKPLVQAAPAQGALPLGKVVMFNSGVSYFEHRGDVVGDAKIELRFRVDDINDLLKSMILEDRGGGTISTVTYGSRDPITKTLKTFPIDLTANPSLGQILDQVRGQRVQIDAPNSLVGVLLGVEKRKQEIGKDHEVVEVEFLNLLTDAGMRSVPLNSVGSIKLLDDKLNADLQQALLILAQAHNTDKKTVTLDLLGKGKRPVRVAYIQETPIWKTSYRLVLDEKDAPFLQGWAIVENTTDDDWNNVNLTLVSGRPISYTMDLYEPLYIHRPLEELNLYASLRAQTYDQDFDQPDAVNLKMAEGLSRSRDSRQRDEASKRMGGLGGGKSGKPAAPALALAAAAPAATDKATLQQGEQDEKEGLDAHFYANAAASSAQAGNVGELFQYVIGAPVTLARQKSAMLPIVNESIKGEKVSIYNEAVQAKHPLNGLKLVNSSALFLMQGPVTVYDGGAYAGDAKIEDLPPGAERLVSYALDLKTEVAPEVKQHPEQIVSVKLVKGLMHVSRKFHRTRTYTVKNSDTKTKTVLIEYPIDQNWKLLSPEKPTEKTRDKYRFSVQAEPGKPVKLVIEEENTVGQQLALNNLDDNTILFYVNQKEIAPAVKTALQEIVKRKLALEKVSADRQRLQQQIGTITEEQNRIRQNMAQLDRNTDLYKRYVQKFGAQEDSVEKLRGQIEKLSSEESHQRQALDDYLVNLNIV